MDQGTRESGRKTVFGAKGNWFILTAHTTKAILCTTMHMAKEFLLAKMEGSIREPGGEMCLTGMEGRLGPMAAPTKALFLKGRRTALGNTGWKTEISTRESGKTIFSKVRGPLRWQMEETTRVVGSRGACTAMESTPGLKVNPTRDSTIWIRKTGTVATSGRTERDTLETGKTTKGMGRAALKIQTAVKGTGYGRRTKG